MRGRGSGPRELTVSCELCGRRPAAWLVVIYGVEMSARRRKVCGDCWWPLDAAVYLRRLEYEPDSGLTDSHSLDGENESSVEDQGEREPW